MNEVYETLKSALLLRKVVSFDYKGHIRIVSPYILGLNKLMGYQSDGGSNSGRLGVPKYFEIHLIANVRIVEGTYVVPPHLPQEKNSGQIRKTALLTSPAS